MNDLSKELQDKVKDFIKDIAEVYKKHNLSIWSPDILYISKCSVEDIASLIYCRPNVVDVLGRSGHLFQYDYIEEDKKTFECIDRWVEDIDKIWKQSKTGE